MRLAAAALLLLAALDVGVPFVDRAGLAAAGLACLALSLPPRPRRIRRAAPIAVPPAVVELDDDADDELGPPAARLSEYLAIAGRST